MWYLKRPIAGLALALSAVTTGAMIASPGWPAARALTERASARRNAGDGSGDGLIPCPVRVQIKQGPVTGIYKDSVAALTVDYWVDETVSACRTAGDLDPATFRASVNGQDQTSRFTAL